MGNRKHVQEQPKQDTKAVQDAQNELHRRMGDVNEDRLARFAAMEEEDMEEGTAEYFKFKDAGEKIDALFLGTSLRNLDSNVPDKQTECADCKTLDGRKILFAQTVIVKELKKRWEKEKELGFPFRIIYKGEVGTGSDKYQSFRILFEN